MTQITFFPLGNADTSLIRLRDGRRMLVDYADRSTGATGDRRCNLPRLLKDDLAAAGRDDYAVVAFSHLDDDHCQGAAKFFWFRHGPAYQGAGRQRIGTLWVPAGAVTEPNLKGDARVIRQEARHRLREGKGIVVFSRPEAMRDWLEAEGLDLEKLRHCFVDAGKPVQGFGLQEDGVEFFAHSPHAIRTDDRGLVDRNSDSLVFQARFREGGTDTDVLFTGDIKHGDIAEIVDVTRKHGNDGRLHWNVYRLPHHCSYTAIGPDKGTDKTEPTEQVTWLMQVQGEPNGYVISPSDPLPYKGSAEDKDDQPPHRQAAEYYKADVLADRRNLLVTMSEPSSTGPKPIVIGITGDGAVKMPFGTGGAAAAAATVAPRAG